MKLREFLARRSTTHSMNPQFMSDEYINRRRSFGRGGAGNIRSREEAILPLTPPPPAALHETTGSHPPSPGSPSSSESDTDGSNSENDTVTTHTHSRRSSSPTEDPNGYHYRYHYRHYRPHHFLSHDPFSHTHENSHPDQHEEKQRRRSSMWSSMSISSSTGTRESGLSSSRLLGGLGTGVRQVLTSGSGSSGHGHGQERRRKGNFVGAKERAGA